MKSKRFTVGLVLTALVLTACSTGPATAPVSVPVPAVESAPAVQAEPKAVTAQDLSDKSYHELLAGRYKEAAAAAEEALKLDPKHAGALYNAGMAALESGDAYGALYRLNKSMQEQPDRFEPYIGLARAAMALGRGALAGGNLELARRAPGGQAEAAKLQPEVAKLTAPGPLPEPCEAVLTDGAGAVYLCLARRSDRYELYLKPEKAGSPAQRISLGPVMRTPELRKGALPGGGVAYWVKSGSARIDVFRWRLFTVREGRLQQVLFKGIGDPQSLLLDDEVKGNNMPVVFGGELAASYLFEPDPRQHVTVRFRLSPDGRVAEQTAYFQTVGGK